MLIQAGIFGAWLAAFAVLNTVSKRLACQMDIHSGLRSAACQAIGSPLLYVMLALYVLCAMLYLAALRIMPLSVAGPVFTVGGAMTTALLGLLLFREPHAPARILGLILCGVGVFLMLRDGSAAS